MNGSALVLRANALSLPLPDESVDLAMMSPPYFALRSYRDHAFVMGPNGKVVEERSHFPGQIGSEAHPQEWLEALWAVMAEVWRVLKPTGSCFVNLGDKRSGSGGHNNSGISRHGSTGSLSGAGKPDLERRAAFRETIKAERRNAPDRYNQAAFGRTKSKMLLPHRFAIGCEDGLAAPCERDHDHGVGEGLRRFVKAGVLTAIEAEEIGGQCQGKGWIGRQDIVWSKLNGLPESVTDRCRDSHEYLFHLVKQPNYFAAVDEVRESYALGTAERYAAGYNANSRIAAGEMRGSARGLLDGDEPFGTNPLGKLPGSVWSIASEPLTISDEVKAFYDLPDHFAAYPTELVRRVVLGWSPSGVCVDCGEGRRPLSRTDYVVDNRGIKGGTATEGRHRQPTFGSGATTQITGYGCACPDASAPTKSAVCLDVFGGTGTTAGVARALGRIGISVDLSMDYSRLASYLIFRSGRFAKAARKTRLERQESML